MGEWDVHSGGKKVGTNRIEKQLSGCLIFEHWTSVTEFSGKSMNYLDPETGTWRQNWVAERGYIIRYEGEIRDGAIHFEGENVGSDGTKALQRVILKPLPDGKLHHRIEQSSDGGKSWSIWFDGTYTRKGSARPGGN